MLLLFCGSLTSQNTVGELFYNIKYSYVFFFFSKNTINLFLLFFKVI